MFKFLRDHMNYSVWYLLLTASIGLVLSLVVGCNKQAATTVPSGPMTFASPEDAGKSLEAAANSQNLDQVLNIFGPGSKETISSGDANEDKSALNGFAKAYQVMNRWRKLSDDTELLLVGADNQAFPIPLMKNSSGQWYFDAAAGKEELLSRRIGNNEINAIGVSEAIAGAQMQYFDQHHEGAKQYAQKFISSEGEQDGLYWPGQPRSPLGPLVAYASAEGNKVEPNQHRPFYGYYFAILNNQGANAKGGAKNYIVNGKMTQGFALIAYPAHYGESGIMTFIINQDEKLFQKDLGTKTQEVASSMTEFNPDKTWTAVE